jgi:hypothetical protein
MLAVQLPSTVARVSILSGFTATQAVDHEQRGSMHPKTAFGRELSLY